MSKIYTSRKPPQYCVFLTLAAQTVVSINETTVAEDCCNAQRLIDTHIYSVHMSLVIRPSQLTALRFVWD